MKNKAITYFLIKKDVFSETVKAISVIIFFLFFLFAFCNFASAQDVIILKSGKEIKADITEEGADIVKYREFDNPAGPLYSIGKDKIATIKYKRGSKDATNRQAESQEKVKSVEAQTQMQSGALQPLETKKRYILLNGKMLSTRKVKTLMEDYPDALDSYEKGKKLCNASNGCAVGVIVTSFISTQIANKKEIDSERIRTASIGLAIDGAFIITAIVMSSVGKHKIRNSVTLYNSAINKPVSYKINFGLQENGIGLAMKF